MDETKTTTCPHRARTIIPYTASNRGSVISILRRLPWDPRKIFTILHFRVPLLQSSKPDTTFQFGQVMDVHLFCKIT